MLKVMYLLIYGFFLSVLFIIIHWVDSGMCIFNTGGHQEITLVDLVMKPVCYKDIKLCS